MIRGKSCAFTMARLRNEIYPCLGNWRGSCSQPGRMGAVAFSTEELDMMEGGEWRERKGERDVIREQDRGMQEDSEDGGRKAIEGETQRGGGVAGGERSETETV